MNSNNYEDETTLLPQSRIFAVSRSDINTGLEFFVDNTSTQPVDRKKYPAEYLSNGHFALARSGKKSLIDCKDFAAVLLNDDGSFNAAIMADGVSKNFAGREAAYCTVIQLIHSLKFNRLHITDEYSARFALFNLKDNCIFPFDILQHPTEYRRGNTTLLCAVRDANQIHIFGVGDTCAAFFNGQKLEIFGDTSTQIPQQIQYFPKHTISTNFEMHYACREITDNCFLCMYTDGLEILSSTTRYGILGYRGDYTPFQKVSRLLTLAQAQNPEYDDITCLLTDLKRI
jgi:serine/threonine protein phosphatase PrpC